MQIVADEIAKEKQMQRLLQLDGDDGAETRQMIKKVHEDNTNMKAKTLPLSKKLRGEIKQLSKEYNYEPQQSRSTLKERYTVLSSVHGEDLRPPVQHGSTLAPATCVEEPPQQRKATVIATTEKGTRSQSSMFDQKKRKSTLGLLANLNATDDTEDVPLTGNGWGPTTRMFVFNGESSIMSLPGVPKFEDMVRSFAVDFWIRTDCKAREGKRILFQILEGQREDLGQLFQIGLNWYEEMDDCIRVMCRDSTNRVLEVLIPLHGTGVTDGTSFHHVMIEMGSVDEGRLECRIDGREMELQVLQQEHPIAFNPWPHRLFVGGYLDESNAPACVFRGTLMQLRFWTLGDTRKPALIWPLLVRDGKLIELTKTIPEDHHETLQNLQRTEEPSPSCSPFFDGNLVVNMGTLAVWGELMHNWRVEIRFRTDVTGKMMNLIGVTDQKYQMQEFGIVLNAEPVFSKERVRYNQLNTTFYVVDAFGACCSALLRGNDRQCLMDGQWHTLVWRCIDSESNKFSVKVDGVFQDLLYVSRDGPHRFDSFENWVCLGGHNVRNWKTKRPFEGQICRFFVSVRSYRFVTLHMDEGPGAYVLQDKSGHRNHGLLINAETNAVRKSDTLWMPAEEQKEEEEAGPKTGCGDL
ncbi:hypothetical protein ADEAN_000675000 [Angomonas deanei]|uniref:Uncharacterized protein n=1 Tax=Angomonas deanei TaxID=59799 RepID=A0A7G2CHA2_9TRYP|nr:hypothetical protein ADEAN_000675000 [Angomonas deanei]